MFPKRNILNIIWCHVIVLHLFFQLKILLTFLHLLAFNLIVELFQCASAVDSLAAYYFNNITMGEVPTSPAAANLARHIADCPNLFPEVSERRFYLLYLLLQSFEVSFYSGCLGEDQVCYLLAI